MTLQPAKAVYVHYRVYGGCVKNYLLHGVFLDSPHRTNQGSYGHKEHNIMVLGVF